MLIHVKVEAGSKVDEVTEKNRLSYIVKVKAAAERNQANRKMIQLLALYFGIVPGKLHIVAGHHAPGKIVEVL